jgi:hypothetical protein
MISRHDPWDPTPDPGGPILVDENPARRAWFAGHSCCIRRARARYWRIARGYLGLGVALGVALGMVLGAASKVCAP